MAPATGFPFFRAKPERVHLASTAVQMRIGPAWQKNSQILAGAVGDEAQVFAEAEGGD